MQRRLSRRLGAMALVAIPLTASLAEAQSADRPTGNPLSSLSGYMDLQFVNPSDADPVIDFRRFVLLFAHRFSDRIRFVSELEVEHAVVEGGEDKGELELEQAYLDFRSSAGSGWRIDCRSESSINSRPCSAAVGGY